MVLKDDRTAGMVINPLGLSLTLDRKSLENMAKKKAELARGYAEEQVEKDTQVMVGDPEEEPEELLDAVCGLEVPPPEQVQLREETEYFQYR